MARILLVDDEANIVDLLRAYLTRDGHEVIASSDGLDALERIRSDQPDVVVLDVMLPGADGLEVCRRARAFSDAYILMLTARTDEMDTIVGLSVGADDYVTKPFSPNEIVARVRALLRRPRGQPDLPPRRVFGDLIVDEGRHEVTRNGALLALTSREFALLAALATHPGRVFTREQLLERVWGDAYYDDHVVDVHVGNLRKKIEDDPSTPRYVETVRGVGYRFNDRVR
ncbi:MAG: response regulator transcription factor [Chloroflexota bacterium]|nr:MAG: response regulator transcription factor [Chloroflexota bacterium]